MRAMRGLGALALVVVSMLLSGCGFGESPQQQAETFVSSVQPGMTWEQVVAIKAPRRYAIADSEAMGGHKQLQEYSEQVIRDSLANNSFKEGFIFHYKFTEDHVYNLWFDEAGKVTQLDKQRTMKDLMSP